MKLCCLGCGVRIWLIVTVGPLLVLDPVPDSHHGEKSVLQFPVARWMLLEERRSRAPIPIAHPGVQVLPTPQTPAMSFSTHGHGPLLLLKTQQQQELLVVARPLSLLGTSLHKIPGVDTLLALPLLCPWQSIWVPSALPLPFICIFPI